MYVNDLKDGISSFYATLHTELLIFLLMSKVLKMSNTMNNWSKAQNTYKHVFAHNFLKFYVCWRILKVSKIISTFDIFNMLQQT